LWRRGTLTSTLTVTFQRIPSNEDSKGSDSRGFTGINSAEPLVASNSLRGNQSGKEVRKK